MHQILIQILFKEDSYLPPSSIIEKIKDIRLHAESHLYLQSRSE